MQFLLSNDDGIDAPGLAALAAALEPLGQVVVVAPEQHHSGCGHQTTTNRVLRVRNVRPNWYAVDGTPADCVRLGVLHLAPQAEWVMAGINEGGNLGVDAFMSGTVAAAREASFLGKSAIAVSQYHHGRQTICWQTASQSAVDVAGRLIPRPCQPHQFWNVNLPAPGTAKSPAELVFCDLDYHPLPVAFETAEDGFLYSSRYHQRTYAQGTDVDVCFSGKIAISSVCHRLPSSSSEPTSNR